MASFPAMVVYGRSPGGYGSTKPARPEPSLLVPRSCLTRCRSGVVFHRTPAQTLQDYGACRMMAYKREACMTPLVMIAIATPGKVVTVHGAGQRYSVGQHPDILAPACPSARALTCTSATA